MDIKVSNEHILRQDKKDITYRDHKYFQDANGHLISKTDPILFLVPTASSILSHSPQRWLLTPSHPLLFCRYCSKVCPSSNNLMLPKRILQNS